jgi:hypothetical protein
MKGITINQLAAMCEEQQKLGNGNKEVIMTSDDEGNEYHQVWEGFTDGKDLVNWVCGYQMCHCKSSNIADYVLLC